jgi:hypothetical protein
MAVPRFDPGEMRVARELPTFFPPGAPPTRIYATPVSLKDGYIAAMKRQPLWQITGIETGMFAPRFYPDNIARALVVDGEGLVMNDQGGIAVGGRDMFGVEWVFVPAVGGSMVRPGNPPLHDVRDWKAALRFPDIGAWDWEGAARRNAAYLKSLDILPLIWIQNGFF